MKVSLVLVAVAALSIGGTASVSAVSPIRTPESQPKPWVAPIRGVEGIRWERSAEPTGSVNPEVIAARKATANYLIVQRCGAEMGGVMLFVAPDFDRDGGARVLCRNVRYLSNRTTDFGPHLNLDDAVSSIVVSDGPSSLSVGMYLDDTWSAHEITLHPGDTIRNAARNPYISNDAYSSVHLER